VEYPVVARDCAAADGRVKTAPGDPVRASSTNDVTADGELP
jgi:hypothetical protein